MKPLIGITTYGRQETDLQNTDYGPVYFTTADYVDAIRQAGAIAVLVPPGEAVFPDVLDRLDGIVFSGGADIDPVFYGGRRDHPCLGKHDPDRDRVEIDGVRAAVARRDLPVLCICRGMQVLNVAHGGTLFEDVLDRSDGEPHRMADGGHFLHPVNVVEGSRTATALGSQSPNGASEHHQGVRDLADGLTETGRAPDGLIEAVEYVGHPWCVAVQWHPETTADADPVQQNLFDAFVQAARSYRNRDVCPGG